MSVFLLLITYNSHLLAKCRQRFQWPVECNPKHHKSCVVLCVRQGHVCKVDGPGLLFDRREYRRCVPKLLTWKGCPFDSRRVFRRRSPTQAGQTPAGHRTGDFCMPSLLRQPSAILQLIVFLFITPAKFVFCLLGARLASKGRRFDSWRVLPATPFPSEGLRSTRWGSNWLPSLLSLSAISWLISFSVFFGINMLVFFRRGG